MSTFYATFRNVRSARAAVHELLRGGLDPDSVSLIANDSHIGPEDIGRGDERHIREEVRSVGDATVFVGRRDDPRQDAGPPSEDERYARLSQAELTEGTMGIDTSDISTDVETFDQSDDSQEVVDRDTFTDGHISHSEHERDDINLAIRTGFPTTVPAIDAPIDSETARQDQNDDGLDTIVVPGFGLVAGGGALATAALDFINPNGSGTTDALIGHLRDEGVPNDRAKALRDAFSQGGAVVAVEIVPGEINEERVEETTERHGASNVGLFDAPRYYQNGGQMPKAGGGAS